MRYSFNTTPTRSRNMRAIKSANNRTTERRIRAHLAQLGISGWRIRPTKLPGCPDFIFPAAKIALFVDGCFWHMCPKCGHVPRSNVAYWREKLRRNKARDRAVNRELRSLGFRVIRIWECEVKRNPRKCLQRVLRLVSKSGSGLRLLNSARFS
jgi:DNA mismatch endonuclease, patch repair protein